MGILLPILYNQQDDRWGNLFLGFNTQLPYNFYNYACLITCLAMVAKYYGKNDTPVTVNDFLKALKPAGFVSGGNYVWGSFNRQYGDIKEERIVTPAALTDVQMGEIKTALENGYPVMLHIDVNPKTVINDMHFVLAIAYNPNDENDITIADPIGGRVHSLKDYLGWFKPNARNTIEGYIIYKGNVPAITPSCLVPNTAEWRKTYEDLVHGSGEWEKTVAEYKPGNDPKTTQFEDVRSVVSGYKSRATDLEKQVNSKNTDLEKANVEIENQKDKVANVQAECQRQLKLKDDQITALNGASKNIEKLEGQYRGTITDLEAKLKDAQKAGGLKDLEIAELKKQLEQAKAGGKVTIDKNLIQALLDFLQGLLKK